MNGELAAGKSGTPLELNADLQQGTGECFGMDPRFQILVMVLFSSSILLPSFLIAATGRHFATCCQTSGFGWRSTGGQQLCEFVAERCWYCPVCALSMLHRVCALLMSPCQQVQVAP